MPRWALPDYIEDLLPAEAMRVERVRRILVDMCVAHGFSLVQPPLIEYVDALTAGTDELDDHLFKVVDQLSGRLLGVRADMTPQAARIDAHLFAGKAENRLCYVGSVLHTRPTALNPTREVVQGGAEVYGVAGIAADIDVAKLLLAICNAIDLRQLHFDVGHSQLFPALAAAAGLAPPAHGGVRESLHRKYNGGLRAHTTDSKINALLGLYGQANETLARARKLLGESGEVSHALTELETLTDALNHDGLTVTVDLADVPNYGYHTGAVYSLYAAGEPLAVARGGRYDNIGAAYGAQAPRAATGFSLDLRLAAAWCHGLN